MKDIKSNFIIVFGVILYFLLAQFSEYWLGIITNHDIGEDFLIYFDAYMKVIANQNPYLPYDIGNSYVNHPFVLTLLSLFSRHQAAFLAMFLWITTSTILWVFIIKLVISFAQSGLANEKITVGSNYKNWIVVAFLGFAPFWETIHIGQINVFALLCLCLIFYYSEQKKPVFSGVFLALAIVLKTSPLIFVPYYLLRREFKLLGSCVITLVLLSLIPAIQFSPNVLVDFLTTLPKLGSEIHPTPYNQSILSLSFRMSQFLGIENIDRLLAITHKVTLGAVLSAILLPILIRPAAKKARVWEFSLLLVTMTLFSPLVWYHHAIFLILPLTLLLIHPNRHIAASGIGILFLIQLERFFEHHIAFISLPTTIAGFLLLGLGLRLFFMNNNERQTAFESIQ